MTVKFSNLSTLADAQRKPRATPRHEIAPSIITKDEKKKERGEKDEAFRAAVWKRDKARCRATLIPMLRSGMDDETVGEIDHAYPRSTAPERIFDVKNGILISRKLNRFRKVACVQKPEFRVFSYTGPDDRGKPQTFVLRDYKTARVVWTRIG